MGGERSEPEGVSRKAAYKIIARRAIHTPLNLHPQARSPPLVADATTFTQREACHGIFSRLTAPYNSRSLATLQAGGQ